MSTTGMPPESPYKGLRPYEEQDRDNFFGRDEDCRILIDKILANRLTLLFAASGVGKSSLLQAAVLPHFKDPKEENLDVVLLQRLGVSAGSGVKAPSARCAPAARKTGKRCFDRGDYSLGNSNPYIIKELVI